MKYKEPIEKTIGCAQAMNYVEAYKMEIVAYDSRSIKASLNPANQGSAKIITFAEWKFYRKTCKRTSITIANQSPKR
jgi:hypothetical protein